MQCFTVPCDFGGRKAPFPVYVGMPKDDNHPLHFQAWWLSTMRGGIIPQPVMDSFARLHKVALEHNVPFEDLCVYALKEIKALEGQPAEITLSNGDIAVPGKKPKPDSETKA